VTLDPDVPVRRTDSPFPSRGTRCAAWWYRPAAGSGRRTPILVMAHGLGGTRGLRLDAYAERFAAAGYHVLLFDYRHFGDSDGEPRQLLGIVRQLSDWRAAVAHARSLPGADPDRVALWGTSLSGGHVLVTAARDRRVAAVVAQVPHVSGVAAARAAGPVMALRLAAHAGRDLARALAGRPPGYVATVGSPGETAAMRSPDALPGIERMVEQSAIDEPSRQVAARVIPQLGMYAPGRLVRRIAAPTLVQLARRDVVTPHAVARRAAARMRRGEVKEYDLGHFDAYVAPHFETVVGDQLAFLRRVLPATPAG
jgi:pimeloyl-ACP methyl ester carboxylesterase